MRLGRCELSHQHADLLRFLVLARVLVLARRLVASVLLLSDGCVGAGGLARAAPLAQMLHTGAEATVHAFGYGSDHDPQLMNGIAEAGGGAFTFVVELASVAEAFAACVGAVTDVIAKRVSLTLSCAPGCRIVNVTTPFQQAVGADGSHTVTLGEMFGGERRDVLVKVAVAARPSASPPSESSSSSSSDPAEDSEQVILPAVVTFLRTTDADDTPPIARHVSVTVTRPVGAVPAAVIASSANEEVDVHVSRVTAVAAIASAVAAASAGRYAEAAATLESTRAVLATCASHTSPVTSALREDLEVCRTRLSTDEGARHGGMAYALQARSGHAYQRSVPSSSACNATALWSTDRAVEFTNSAVRNRSRGDAHASAAMVSAYSPAMQSRMVTVAAATPSGRPPMPTPMHAPAPMPPAGAGVGAGAAAGAAVPAPSASLRTV